MDPLSHDEWINRALCLYMQTKNATNDVHAEKVNDNPAGKVADWQLQHSGTEIELYLSGQHKHNFLSIATSMIRIPPHTHLYFLQ